MSGVDNKVVKMTFDNSSFQKNVAQTMSSLDALKKSLDFKGAGEGIKGVSAAAGKIDLSPIHTSIESVNSGFLAMATVAATAISGITSKAVAAGGQMVKSLAIDPMTDGFQEYETNMNSIQTILANTKSKGSTLDDVNAALDQMNEYSDKTIYNFSQMAKNVSKFTAAGVDLDTSVSSIKGLANVAALMGVKNEEAQRSMFQLSQAIGSGTVKLKDWISVEQAGMSGEGFNDALVQTGMALGELTKMPVGTTLREWEKENGKFRDSLESGWLTTEVLTTALGAMAGDLDAIELSDMGFDDDQVVKMVELGQTAMESATDVKTASQLFQTLKETIGSGWAKTFSEVFGNFKEAKGLFTNLNNFFGGFVAKSAKARNDVLSQWSWGEKSGRIVFLEGLTKAINAVRIVIGSIGSAFREVFPRKTAIDLYNMSAAFRDFAEKITINENGLKRIKQIFTAFFSVVKIGIEIIKGIARVAGALIGVFFSLIGAFAGSAGSAGDFISKIREILVESGGIEKFFDIIVGAIQKFADVILWVRDKVGGVFDFARDKTAPVFAKAIEPLQKVFESIGASAGKLGGVAGIFEKISAAWDLFTSIMLRGDFPGFTELLGIEEDSKIVDFLFDVREALMGFTDVWRGFVSLIKDGDFIGFGELLFVQEDSAIVGFLLDVHDAIVNFYNAVTGIDIGGALSDAFGNFKGLFDGFDISVAASEVLTSITDFFENLIDTISGWDSVSEAFTDIRNAITNFFSGLFTSTKDAGVNTAKGLTEIPSQFSTFVDKLKLSLELATEVVRSQLKEFWESIKAGLSVAGINVDKIFDSIANAFGNAGDSIGNAFGGVGDKITNWFKTFSWDKVVALFAAGMAASLFKSVGRFSKGFEAIGAGLKTFSEDGFKFGFNEDIIQTLDRLQSTLKTFQNNLRADTLMKIAIAFGVLTLSIIALSFVDAEKIAVGMGAMAAGIATIVGAMALLAKMSTSGISFAGMGVGIAGVAVAVLLLAAAVMVFGNMDPDVLMQGLLAVSVALLALGASAALMSKGSGGFIRAAISIAILSGSLVLLAQAIKYYANMDIPTLLKGGYIITGILISLAVLSNIVDGTAMQKFGVGLGFVSLSLWGLSKVIERFAEIPFWAMMQGLLGLGLTLAIVITALKAMPDEKKSAAGTIALIGLAAALWIMSKAIETIGNMATGGVIQAVLALMVVIGLLVAATLVLNYFGANVGPILTLSVALLIFAGALYVLGQLDLAQVGIALLAIAGVFVIFGIAGLVMGPVIPVLLALGLAMLAIGSGVFLFGAGLALIGLGLLNLSKISSKAIPAISKSIRAFVAEIPKIARALAEGFVEMIRVIGETAGDIADAIGDLLIALLEKVQELVPVIGETIGVIIETILTLIVEKVPRIIEVGLILITAFLTGIRDNIGIIVTLGIEIMANFLQGLADGIPLMGQAIRNLITALVNEVVLNIQLIINAGVSILVALLNGIAAAIPQIVTAVGNVITAFITAIGGEMGRIIDVGVITLLSFLWGITNNLQLIGTELQKMFNALLDTIETVLLGDEKGQGGVIDKGIGFVKRFLSAMVDKTIGFANYMGKLVVELLRGLTEAIETYAPEIRDAAKDLALAIIDGMTGGLGDNVGKVVDKVKEVAGDAIGKALEIFGINSPSKVFREIGHGLNEGLVMGINDTGNTPSKAVKGMADSTVKAFGAAMSGVKYDLEGMEEFNPTITPVLDLTRVGKDAKGLSSLLGGNTFGAEVSSLQAQYLAKAQKATPDAEPTSAAAAVTQIKFEQTINSPTALTPNDIYRSTKSQLAIAKEELKL